MAATTYQDRYIVSRTPIPCRYLLLVILGIQIQWLLAQPHAASGQKQNDTTLWYEKSRIMLPRRTTGIARIAAAPWTANFYLLDDLQLQILAMNPEGEILHQYGGWGTGRLSLDLPVCMQATENSVFILDQGKYQILRLDAMLNPIVATPLPEDWLPLAFCRDIQRRFWVIYENREGIHLYDDAGTVVDVIADRTDGITAILHPRLIAASSQKIAVWDAAESSVSVFLLSGQFIGERILPKNQAPLAIIWQDQQLLLATGDRVLAMPSLRSTIIPILENVNLIDLAFRLPHLFGLDPSGNLRVFRRLP